MRTISIPSDRGRRGSVLLLVLILSLVVGGLAVSFSDSGRLQLDASRDVSAELHSDLATQSGLEFAQRQLLLDPQWAGTGSNGLTVGNGLRFAVTRDDSGGATTLEVDGSFGESRSRLAAEVETGGGGTPLSDHAVVFLGREFDAAHVHLHDGGLLLADQLGVIDDWVNHPGGGGDWVAGGPSSLGVMDLDKFHIWDSVLQHYTDTDYRLKHGTQEQITQRVQMPAWDLSDWAIPGPGKTIFTGTTHIAHLHTPDTVVVIADPSDEIHIENSHIDGGVVVWCENTYDLRGPFRNRVKIENCHIGDGMVPHVGVLAPASQIELENCHVSGLNFVQTYKELENNQVSGQVIVVDQFYLENSHIYFDPLVVQNPPPGISYPHSGSGVSLQGIREVYQ